MVKVSRWKDFERRIARRFGGARVIRPDWGRSNIDVTGSGFLIECKYREKFNVEKALVQAEETAKRLGLEGIPLAVCQKPGRNTTFVAFRFRSLGVLGLVTSWRYDLSDEVTVMTLDSFLGLMRAGGVLDAGEDDKAE